VTTALYTLGANLASSCRFVLSSPVYVTCLTAFLILIIAWPLGAPERLVWLAANLILLVWIVETIRLVPRYKSWQGELRRVDLKLTPMRIFVSLGALGLLLFLWLVLLAMLGVGN